MLKWLFVSCLSLITFQVEVSGQETLSLTLLDAVTKAPVGDAFVFFSGSSTGGVSDAEGKVELPLAEYLELVISHLGYETKVLSLDEIAELSDPVILLAANAISLGEVRVQSSARDAKKRKRWFRRFISAFLGPQRDRKDVAILNPEAILFEETPGGLRAEATDRLRIANEALGYEVSFLLDTFLLTDDDEVFYGGKAFFQDLREERPARAVAWQEARRKSFVKSKAYFFRQLASNALDEQRFTLGRTRFDKDLVYLGFTPVATDELRWERGLRADTLYFTGFLTAMDRTVVTKWTNQSAAGGVVAAEFATSFLRSRSGRFIVGPSGMLLNNLEVEELGYWADQRVARLLPVDYQSEKGEAVVSSLLPRFLDSLTARQRSYPEEKVYLHLDKPYYGLRDDIWFRAYLLDAVHHQDRALSKVVHVELIDPQGRISQTLALHKEQSFNGRIRLDSTARPGLYQLRAYTDFMRNGSPGYFFRRALPVYDPQAIGSGVLTGIDFFGASEGNAADRPDPVTLTMHPEGGAFLAGVSNRLILSSTDAEGVPLKASGKIFNLADEPVADWSTNGHGMGALTFIPEAGESYWAEANHEGVSYRFRLPQADEKGYALRVDNLQSDYLEVKVMRSLSVSPAGVFLIGHVRGQVFCSLNEPDLNKAIAFSRAEVPEGLGGFALFSAAGELLGQRHFYNERRVPAADLEVTIPYAFFRPRQKVRLEIGWADSLLKESASLSVAVTDRAIVQRSETAESLKNYLLLSAELPQRVPAQLLSLTERKELDLLLATHTQGRFNWTDLIRSARKELSFSPQQGASLEGYVASDKVPQGEMAEVILTALHPRPVIVKVLTDPTGRFSFRGLPYLESVEYLLQAARFDPKRFDPDIPLLTSKDRRVTIHRLPREAAPLPENLWPASVRLPEKLVNAFAEVAARDQQSSAPEWAIDLDEVTVTGRQVRDSRNFEVFDLNKLDFIAPEKPVFNLLGTLKPGYRFIRDLTRNQLVAEVNDGYGFIVKRPVSIMIDGSTASFGRFQGLTADMIDYLVINPTSIVITTRNQPRSGGKQTPGVAAFSTSGFLPEQVFPAPDYTTPSAERQRPDGRTTIHWESELRIETGEKAVLTFFAADVETAYDVHIEGITDTGEPVEKTLTIRIVK